MKNSEICLICSKSNFKNSNSFTKHIRIHKLGSKEYYDKYIDKGNEELCKCGRKIGFSSIDKGYSKQCRFCNNKNPERVKKIKETVLNRYGVENPSQVEEFKKKRKETNLERYGVEYASSNPEIMKRCLETWKENYKEGHPGRDPKIEEKKKQVIKEKINQDQDYYKKISEKRVSTNLEKYGVEYSLSDPEVYEKRNKAMIEKYGTKHALQVPEIKEKISGPNNYRWIENREQRFAPYTEKFHDLIYRQQIKEEQNNIDPVTEELLNETAHLHHIDYNKQNDNRENLIWLNHSIHAQTNTNREEWKQLLQKMNQEIINVSSPE